MKGARGFGDLFAAQQLAVVFAFDARHDVPSAALRLAGLGRRGHFDKPARLHLVNIAVDGHAGSYEEPL
jgi:hypothetical protein